MSEGRERRAQPPAAGGVEAAAGFLDRHLLALRILSPALAGAGILILARSVRLSTKFSTVLDVPDTFIQKQVQLRGKVHRITEKGLEVEHVPIALPFISSLQRKYKIAEKWHFLQYFHSQNQFWLFQRSFKYRKPNRNKHRDFRTTSQNAARDNLKLLNNAYLIKA
eukprot:gi/632934929/ref/XP_007887082.1/ PREDICTED: protein C3orf33 homolog isoform X2 [Callorhinchus milii]